MLTENQQCVKYCLDPLNILHYYFITPSVFVVRG